MNKFIIYCTMCTVNNKIYIGQHVTPNPDKWDRYLGNGVYADQPSSYNRDKTVFLRAVHKHGPKNFVRKVLAIVDTQEEADALERELVNEEFLKRKDVYNVVIGGTGGDRGLNAKPCYQYDLEGNFIAEYPNRQEASRAMNRGFTTIKRAISDKIKAAGFLWSEEKVDKLDVSKYNLNTNGTPVFEYAKTGEYNCCYESFVDAGRCNGVSDTHIREAALCGTLAADKYWSLEYSEQFSNAKLEQMKLFPVYLYTIEGKFIKEFPNLKSVQKELKSRCDLFRYIRLGKVYREYLLSFEKLPEMPNKSKKPVQRKVNQYDLEGNFIKTWDSLAELTKIYGGGVRHCLTGRNKSSKGFTYKYLDEVNDIV